MSDLTPTVTLVGGVPCVLSTDIAEKFRKSHKDVLRAIERIIADLEQGFRERNFAPTSIDIPGPNGAIRKSPAYNLTRDAFSLVAMSFTGKEALIWKVRYIETFSAMEAALLKEQPVRRGRPKKALPTNDGQARTQPLTAPRTSLEEIENRLTALCQYVLRERQRVYVDLLNQFCATNTSRFSSADIVCSSISDALFHMIDECLGSCSDTPLRHSNPCRLVRDVKAMLER